MWMPAQTFLNLRQLTLEGEDVAYLGPLQAEMQQKQNNSHLQPSSSPKELLAS